MKAKILIFSILLAGLALMGLFNYRMHLQCEKLDLQIATLKMENSRLEYVNGLAVEFNISPAVVEVVDHYSQEHWKSDAPSYRLIVSPENYTYLMLSLIQVESSGDPTARGDGGKAYGLTQMWLTTARDYEPEVKPAELLTIEGNIRLAFDHFEALLNKYGGNPYTALVSWNRGMGTVDKWLLAGVSPANGYEAKVLLVAQANSKRVVRPQLE